MCNAGRFDHACGEFELTMRRIISKICVSEINSHAGGEQQRERTDPGSNQFLHHRQSRPVGEKASNGHRLEID